MTRYFARLGQPDAGRDGCFVEYDIVYGWSGKDLSYYLFLRQICSNSPVSFCQRQHVVEEHRHRLDGGGGRLI